MAPVFLEQTYTTSCPVFCKQMSLDTEETPVIGLSNEYLIREFGMLILKTL